MSLFLRAVIRSLPWKISVRGYKCSVLFPLHTFLFISCYVHFSILCWFTYGLRNGNVKTIASLPGPYVLRSIDLTVGKQILELACATVF